MGFNFQGIVINRLYTSVDSVIKDFNIPELEFVGESSFEESSSSAIGNTDVFVTTINNSSFCTFGSDLNIEDIEFKLSNDENFKAMRFAIYETPMAFAFEYFQGLESIRSKFIFPGQIAEERGELLQIEKEETDMTEIIFTLIGKVCGSDFWDINLDTKSMHYKF